MPFASPFLRPRIFHTRIQLRPDGRFTFGRGGKMARLVNVPDDFGWYGDCVAWMPGNDGEWWSHQGRLPILGLPEVMFAADVGCDLYLVETPARWVELATTGPWPGPCAAILGWDARDSVCLWLSLVQAVRCESPSLAGHVRRLLGGRDRRQRVKITLHVEGEAA
jgi:hypothetical protein